MPNHRLPLIVEADKLDRHLGETDLRVVDLSRAELHQQYHIPGAVYLDYGELVSAQPPIMGLLPDDTQLKRALSAIGLTPETHVVAYDDEGGGKAARLLWTLEILGHSSYSLLNGGLHAWANEGHALTTDPASLQQSDYQVQKRSSEPVADRDYILAHLHDPDVALLDARSPDEYSGKKRFAAKGGHIPGAVNIEWTQGMDAQRNLRLRPSRDLQEMLKTRGITPDKTVVTYCQTHHRSAFAWLMLRALGYERVKGYPGSWSDWGNDALTPVE